MLLYMIRLAESGAVSKTYRQGEQHSTGRM